VIPLLSSLFSFRPLYGPMTQAMSPLTGESTGKTVRSLGSVTRDEASADRQWVLITVVSYNCTSRYVPIGTGSQSTQVVRVNSVSGVGLLTTVRRTYRYHTCFLTYVRTDIYVCLSVCERMCVCMCVCSLSNEVLYQMVQLYLIHSTVQCTIDAYSHPSSFHTLNNPSIFVES